MSAEIVKEEVDRPLIVGEPLTLHYPGIQFGSGYSVSSTPIHLPETNETSMTTVYQRMDVSTTRVVEVPQIQHGSSIGFLTSISNVLGERSDELEKKEAKLEHRLTVLDRQMSIPHGRDSKSRADARSLQGEATKVSGQLSQTDADIAVNETVRRGVNQHIVSLQTQEALDNGDMTLANELIRMVAERQTLLKQGQVEAADEMGGKIKSALSSRKVLALFAGAGLLTLLAACATPPAPTQASIVDRDPQCDSMPNPDVTGPSVLNGQLVTPESTTEKYLGDYKVFAALATPDKSEIYTLGLVTLNQADGSKVNKLAMSCIKVENDNGKTKMTQRPELTVLQPTDPQYHGNDPEYSLFRIDLKQRTLLPFDPEPATPGTESKMRLRTKDGVIEVFRNGSWTSLQSTTADLNGPNKSLMPTDLAKTLDVMYKPSVAEVTVTLPPTTEPTATAKPAELPTPVPTVTSEPTTAAMPNPESEAQKQLQQNKADWLSGKLVYDGPLMTSSGIPQGLGVWGRGSLTFTEADVVNEEGITETLKIPSIGGIGVQMIYLGHERTKDGIPVIVGGARDPSGIEYLIGIVPSSYRKGGVFETTHLKYPKLDPDHAKDSVSDLMSDNVTDTERDLDTLQPGKPINVYCLTSSVEIKTEGFDAMKPIVDAQGDTLADFFADGQDLTWGRVSLPEVNNPAIKTNADSEFEVAKDANGYVIFPVGEVVFQ